MMFIYSINLVKLKKFDRQTFVGGWSSLHFFYFDLFRMSNTNLKPG